MKKNPVESFQAKVHHEPNSGRHLWGGTYFAGGLRYGKAVVDGRHVRAHRRAWEIYRGQIPSGMHVLHKCDIPQCVNPDHLFLGTQADNNKDMYAKGRSYDRNGHNNPRSKLTAAQVDAIRSLGKSDQAAIAKKYGVSQSTISRIQRGQVYRDA